MRIPELIASWRAKISRFFSGSAENAPDASTRKKGRRMVLMGLGGIALLALIFILIATRNLPSLAEIENPESNLSTQIISADGVVLQNFFTDENRTNVSLREISPYVIHALLATEDKRFYSHSGMDPQGPPAILKDMLLKGGTRGASTITMQLARNLFEKVGTKRSFTRKIKEVIVAWVLERKFTKDEILNAYLNTVNIYGEAYGIQAASLRLFGKNARDLQLHEAALVVAMLKGQGVYNPYRRPERATSRRNLVLDLMVENNFIDPAKTDIEAVKQRPLGVRTQEMSHLEGAAPYFREHLRKELKQWCSDHGYDLYTSGLKVYTTIDSRMQRYAEEAVRQHLSSLQRDFDKAIKGKEPYVREPDILKMAMQRSERYKSAKKAGKPDSEIEREFEKKTQMTIFSWRGPRDTLLSPMDSLRYYARMLETGLVSIDPTNGHVKAWVGGIDFRYFKYDHVAQGARQVGSTFKPMVYAVAIDNGMQPCTRVLNQRIVFEEGGQRWEPKNSDGSIGGVMTLRQGLAQSMNLVTARIIKEVGPPAVVEFAKQAGITSKLEAVPSLCLGVCDLTVLELTGAYTLFANRGIYQKPVYITRIEDKNGQVIEEFIPESRQVLSEEKAYMMVDLLRGVVDEPGGTAGRLRWRYGFKNEIAGKTGTTQNNSDGWFEGITPNLVTGVWTGCADRRMRFSSTFLGQGANMALPVWGIYMQKVYADKSIGLPQDPFVRPLNYFRDESACADLDEANGQPQQSEFDRY